MVKWVQCYQLNVPQSFIRLAVLKKKKKMQKIYLQCMCVHMQVYSHLSFERKFLRKNVTT